MALLELKDVVVKYHAIEAVRGISMSVEQGEVVTLIGSNGAGKTTTLKTISGVLRPTSGTITLQVEGAGGPRMAHLERMPAHEIVSLGVSQAPEGRHIFPRMSVRENLTMGAFARSDHAGIAEDLERALVLFPVLKERLGQAGGTLSGGEQQMLAIGRALMARPRILLLDEPSMGLAPLFVERIFEIITTIKDQGTTILLVEQNAQKALQVADRGYVLETGAIVLQDEASNLLGNDQVRKAYLGES